MGFQQVRGFQPLHRSKSESDIDTKSCLNYSIQRRYSSNSCSRRSSESSAEGFSLVVNDYYESEEAKHDVFGLLEEKIDKLNDLFLEQCRLMTELKEDLLDTKTVMEKYEDIQSRMLKKSLLVESGVQELAPSDDDVEFNSRARSLLDAIEAKQAGTIDRELRSALVDLVQSEELKQRIVSASAEALRGAAAAGVARDVPPLYAAALKRAHRRLARQVSRSIEDGFAELEANSVQLSNSVCDASRSLRHALRHQGWLQGGAGRGRASDLRCFLENTIQKELEGWRGAALAALTGAPPAEETPPELPGSPPQPAHPDSSVIDQLMKTAMIHKQIEDGAVNEAFSAALSAADLCLVMAACRAAPPARVFAPCRLDQTVLLSLAQQLPTDMVHETQLKCRYLEETLMNLDPMQPATRTHLPLVVREIRTHLTNFLAKYPSHVANRRITLIIMAADNLLK